MRPRRRCTASCPRARGWPHDSAMRALLLGLAAAALTAVAPAAAALRVVAATTDVAALAAVIGGDLVAVETIVPPAVDPEAFEPRPSDLDKVRHADLLLRVRLRYDYWLCENIPQVGGQTLVRRG